MDHTFSVRYVEIMVISFNNHILHRCSTYCVLCRFVYLQDLQARGLYEFAPNAYIELFAPEVCELAENACDFFIGEFFAFLRTDFLNLSYTAVL